MSLPNLLVQGLKLAGKGTGFVSLVAVVNIAPVAAYEHFWPWNQKELERGIRDQQCRP